MAYLQIQETITDTVTRQTLYNAWATATMGKVTETDLSPEIEDILMATNFSGVTEPRPGRAFYHQADQILYIFHDAIDVMDSGGSTGVSLWLAVGPDRFETACLAAEPIPAGAVVEPTLDRWCRVCRPEGYNPIGDTNTPIPIGINQSGLPDEGPWVQGAGITTPSGSWFRCAIDGFMRAWFPSPSMQSGASETTFQVLTTNQHNWLGILPGTWDDVAGGVGGRSGDRTLAGAYTIGHALHHVTVASGYTAGYHLIRWTGLTGHYNG